MDGPLNIPCPHCGFPPLSSIQKVYEQDQRLEGRIVVMGIQEVVGTIQIK